MMSELRKDLVSGRWVIIATERSKRPDDFRPGGGPAAPAAEAVGFCPFCEGNEGKTPPEVFALRGPGTAGRIRRAGPSGSCPTSSRLSTAARRRPRPARAFSSGWRGSASTRSSSRTPSTPSSSPTSRSPTSGTSCASSSRGSGTIESELHYQYVQLFKNKGKEAGASLSHPHSQIVATPIVPKRIKEEIYGADRMLRAFKECGFCRILREEEAAGKRLVARGRHFTAIAPYASRFPFEMAVFPQRHSAFFTDVREDELLSLAETLKHVLTRLKDTVGDPPYNMVLHQAPNRALALKGWPDIDQSYHWHLEIFPILTKVAGFEWGTGFYINPVPPETAAQFLRQP